MPRESFFLTYGCFFSELLLAPIAGIPEFLSDTFCQFFNILIYFLMCHFRIYLGSPHTFVSHHPADGLQRYTL